MIVVPGPLDPPAGRLLAALAARGEAVVDAAALPRDGVGVTLALSTGRPSPDLAALLGALARPVRLLVLSRLGAHPDARAQGLARLWRLEEMARAAGVPVLTLRFAPLLGPGAPLWERLRWEGVPGRHARRLLNPALEADAVETLSRAVDGRAAWSGWYEVAGPEAWTLAELRELARSAGRGRGPGAWTPPLEEMAEHRLAEAAPWCAWSGVAPGAIADLATRSAA